MSCNTSQQAYLLHRWQHSERARQYIVYKSAFLSCSIFRTMALVWNMASIPSVSVKRSSLSSRRKPVLPTPSTAALLCLVPSQWKLGRHVWRETTDDETLLSGRSAPLVQPRWPWCLQDEATCENKRDFNIQAKKGHTQTHARPCIAPRVLTLVA